MTTQLQPLAPLLVFGWGNPSRGDDALGPLCAERLRAARLPAAGVEFLDDYQLQIEHALDLVGRQRVLFVDASSNCCAPFEVTLLRAARDASFSTHAMSPQALMLVFRELYGEDPPPCTLLAIRGEQFTLGEALSAAALSHLAAALEWADGWLAAASAGTRGSESPDHPAGEHRDEGHRGEAGQARREGEAAGLAFVGDGRIRAHEHELDHP